MKVVQTTFANAQALAIIVDRALGYPKVTSGWDGTGLTQILRCDSVDPRFLGSTRQLEYIWYRSDADCWYPMSDATVTAVNASSLVSAGDKATINAAVRVDIGADPKSGGRIPKCHFIGPTVYWLGDSLTQASVTADEPYGGMRAIFKDWCVARGYHVDHIGTINMGSMFDNENSGIGGDTCALMNARCGTELSTTVFGHEYVKLCCLMAGSNDVALGRNTTDYATLLGTLHTALVANQPTARIAVCKVPPRQDFDCSAYNAALPGVWDTFDAAHPSNTVIRWSAWDCFGGVWSSAYFYDVVHLNHAGYLKVVTDPTYGLAQALNSYLATIGAWP